MDPHRGRTVPDERKHSSVAFTLKGVDAFDDLIVSRSDIQ